MIQKIIITGGACVGKTTLIKMLKLKGHNTICESGREVYISEQNKTKEDGGYIPKLPNTDYVSFEEMVIARQIEKEKNLKNEVYFLDRSLVDCLGMSFFQGNPLKSDIKKLIAEANYHTTAFLLSPLEKYETDEQRKETKQQMLRMHSEIKRAYVSQGFSIVEVPIMSPEERVEFILKNLRQKSS